MKFDWGCGWSIFFTPISGDAIATETDLPQGMRRIQLHGPHRDTHLGHVFPDGPVSTGQRYYVTSTSLGFEADQKGCGCGSSVLRPFFTGRLRDSRTLNLSTRYRKLLS